MRSGSTSGKRRAGPPFAHMERAGRPVRGDGGRLANRCRRSRCLRPRHGDAPLPAAAHRSKLRRPPAAGVSHRDPRGGGRVLSSGCPSTGAGWAIRSVHAGAPRRSRWARRRAERSPGCVPSPGGAKRRQGAALWIVDVAPTGGRLGDRASSPTRGEGSPREVDARFPPASSRDGDADRACRGCLTSSGRAPTLAMVGSSWAAFSARSEWG